MLDRRHGKEEPTTETVQGRRRALSSRRSAAAVAAVIILAIVNLAVPTPVSPAGEGEYTLTSRTVWSFYTETPPELDDPEASVWDYPLQVIGLVPGHVSLSGGTSLDIRSLYTDTDLFMRIIWQDVVENSGLPRWVYHDGNWTFTSPFEDGVGVYFPIGDPQGLFPVEGCMRTCHVQDWENPQNQERKYTYLPGERGDMWFWSAGLTNPWDFALDTFVDDTPADNNVGYHEDPEMGLGMLKNRHLTEYMEYIYLSRPVYMQDPGLAPALGPEVILRGEEAVFDQNFRDPNSGESGVNPITHEKWRNGDVVGGYVVDHLPETGLGQVDAVGSYDVVDQTWSLVIRRALDTGDPVNDVIFDDLGKTYQFAISLFGDIMGGGDASEPFTEPTSSTDGSRCVMNKVTNTIGLRFRPVVRVATAGAGEPEAWDAAAWDAKAPPMLHELIHRSGEIHDTWDLLNVSAAQDGTDLSIHLSYEDRNRTTGYQAEVALLRPGAVSLEEAAGLISWSESHSFFMTSNGDADVWRWEWNATALPDGRATDMLSTGGKASDDTLGPGNVTARTWYDGSRRHIVLTRALDTGLDGEDLCFHDLARTYAARIALRTDDWDQWLITYPVTLRFLPDPLDHSAPGLVGNITATDGRDSDAYVTWSRSPETDFAHYRVYATSDDLDWPQVELMDLVARVSDPDIDEVHITGLEPDTDWGFTVVAVDDSGNVPQEVNPLSACHVTDTTPPPALTGVGAFDALDSDLIIRWNTTDVADFDRYELYLEEVPFTGIAGLVPINTIRAHAVGSHRVAGLEVDRTYHAAVVAVDWAGNALRTVQSVSVVPSDITAPPEVRGLDASVPLEAGSEGEVLLRWRDSSAADVAAYRVYVSLTPIASVQDFEPRAMVDAPATAVRLANLSAGTVYHFAVTAVDAMGHEGPAKYTTSCRASTAAPPTAPAALTAEQVGADGARLNWTPSNGSLVVRYDVYLGTGPILALDGPNVTLAGNVSATAAESLLVTGLEPGATYYFTVVAVDARGRTSAATLPSASLALQVAEEHGPSFMERWGLPIALLAVIVVLAAALWVVTSRMRRYGALLSRAPPWKRKNGGNGNGGSGA